MGGIGLPVFAGGSAGFHVLIGPSAGYLWFDLLYAGVTAYLTHPKTSPPKIFLANLLGDRLVFVGVILGLHLLAGMPLVQATTVGVLPFILPDLGKLVAITLLSQPIFRSLKGQGYFQQ